MQSREARVLRSSSLGDCPSHASLDRTRLGQVRRSSFLAETGCVGLWGAADRVQRAALDTSARPAEDATAAGPHHVDPVPRRGRRPLPLAVPALRPIRPSTTRPQLFEAVL